MQDVTHGGDGGGSPERWQSQLVALVWGVLACAALVAALGPPESTVVAPPTVRPATSSTAPTTGAAPVVAATGARVVQAAAPPRTTRRVRAASTSRAGQRVGSSSKRAPEGRRTVGVGKEVRAVPARSVEGSSQEAQVRTVLSLRFTAREGERRMVAAEVKAYQPDDTTDRLLMASTSLSCSPSAGRVRNSSATANLVRGKSTLLSTAFVYVAPRSGEVTCVVRAYGSRPRPSRSGQTGWNRWYAWHGSRLYLGIIQPHWAASASKSTRSRLIGRGQRTSTLSRYAAGSSGRTRVLLVSDHKITTCSSARGSRDATTRGRELCAGHVQKTGTRVRLMMRVLQGDGTSCTSRPVVDRVYRISPTVHHRTIRGLVVLAPPESRCRGVLTVSTTLVNLAGAPAMVHTASGRTSVARG